MTAATAKAIYCDDTCTFDFNDPDNGPATVILGRLLGKVKEHAVFGEYNTSPEDFTLPYWGDCWGTKHAAEAIHQLEGLGYSVKVWENTPFGNFLAISWT